MTTIGAVCHVFEECDALPGWLEMATRFFDDVRVVHAGLNGELSHDGTIEILERWKVPHCFDTIDDGFGPLRTRCARYSPCDWVAVLDADDRFLPILNEMTCDGVTPIPPVGQQVLQEYDTPTEGACPFNWENEHNVTGRFRLDVHGPMDQGRLLRHLIGMAEIDAVVTIRRQWRDLAMTLPAQNWHIYPDHQARIIRNLPHVQWQNAMHETLLGCRQMHTAGMLSGPFLEHLHLPLKAMRPDKRRRDIETYREIWRRK